MIRVTLLHCRLATLVLFTFFPTILSAYQLVIEGEDPAFNVRQGTWFLDKTNTQFNGNYAFSVQGPGSGSNILDWDIDGIPGGIYRVDYYIANGPYASMAEYIVEDDDEITTVIRSQYLRPAGWYSLGQFNFASGRGRVTQTDHWTGAGTKVIADALRVTWIGSSAPVPNASFTVPPEVSIVIDDLGTYDPANFSDPTAQLFQQAPNISYAVMPFQAYTVKTLETAAAMGIETILHQPMQYYDLPDSNATGDITRLYRTHTPAELLFRLNRNLNNVAPYVAGVNNHQGSLFSSFAPGMHVVLDDLKSRGLYFLDSRTISDAVAYDLSKDKGMLTAERDLFIDGTTAQHTKDLILQVATQAKFQPHLNYIMIGHQRAATLPGLFAALPELASMGVAIKPLERNLHYIMETDAVPPGASLELEGSWTSTTQDMISHECRNGEALVTNETNASARFRPNLPKAGKYRVFCANTLAIAQVTHKNGTSTGLANHLSYKYTWRYLGTFPFDAGTAGSVKIMPNAAVGDPTMADAVKLVWDGPLDDSGVESWKAY